MFGRDGPNALFGAHLLWSTRGPRDPRSGVNDAKTRVFGFDPI